MIPLSVFPFPSAPCHKRVVSYPIIAFCCRSFNLSVTPAACHCPGCGTQHPQRFACVLLAAAPTATPCFRHWRRSSPLPLVGEPLAKRLTFPICQSLPSIGEVASRSDDGEVFCTKRGPDSCPALFEVSAYSALVSGFASSALASGFAAGAAGAAGFTTGFGGYGSSFRGKRMIFFGHFWAHIPQPLHLS